MAEDTLYGFIEVLLSKTKYAEPLRQNPLMADLLCTAAMRGSKTLAMSLLAHGVGADTVGTQGESLLSMIDELPMPQSLDYLKLLPSNG